MRRRVWLEQTELVACAVMKLLSQFQTQPLRPCWSMDCKPVWLLAKTPKGTQQREGYKARVKNMNPRLPFGFLSASSSDQGHSVLIPSINLVKVDPSHSNSRTHWKTSNTTRTSFSKSPSPQIPAPSKQSPTSEVKIKVLGVAANSLGCYLCDTSSILLLVTKLMTITSSSLK